jgi:hypothetical protein
MWFAVGVIFGLIVGYILGRGGPDGGSRIKFV